MARSSNLPRRLRQILNEKVWRDPTKSGSAMEHLEKLHSRFQRRGEFNRNHLQAISGVWTKHGLKFNGAQKPWDLLFWFAQFYSRIYTYHPENADLPHKRLFIGTLLERDVRLEIWVGIGSKLQFYDGPGPDASSISFDNAKRLEVEWYSPLNEIFDLEGMPYDDPTKTPGTATEAQELKYLTDEASNWRQRQNNHIKFMILLLEAFPGLIMREGTEVSKSGEDLEDNQVYKDYPSFPFLDEQVDTSRPDLSTLLQKQDIESDDDFVTSDTISEVSSSGEEPTKKISEVDGRKRKSTDKVTTKTASKSSKTTARPGKQLSADHSKTPAPKKRSSNTIATATTQGSRAALRSDLRSSEPTSNPEVSETAIRTSKSRINDLDASKSFDGNQKALYLLILSLPVLILLLRWLLKTPTPTRTSD
ncbi:hypothetical protein KCU77_g1576, partial [Aureobasidium melanogenum]